MEAVTIIDVMRRAGASVTVASVESDLAVKCSRDVMIVADALMPEAAKKQYDLIVLPVSMHAYISHNQYTGGVDVKAMTCRAVHQDLKL